MRYRLILFILFFVIYGVLPSQAQVFSWREPNQKTCYKIDFVSKELFASDDQGIWKSRGPMEFHDVVLTDIFSRTEGLNPFHVDGDPGTYLSLECTGQVYYFDVNKHSLTRLDHTFFRGANCLAAQFSRKGQFYSFGGYGFWQSTNILTKYNAKAQEWTHINAPGDLPKSINKYMSGYNKAEDLFFALGSRRINQSESSEILDMDFGLFQFDFTSSKFKRLGEIHEPILRELLHTERNSEILNVGHYMVILPYKFIPGYTYEVLYILDLKEPYQAYIWENPTRIQIQKRSEVELTPINFYSIDETIYFPQMGQTFPYGKVEITAIKIQDMIRESKSLGSIMEKPWTDSLQEVGILLGVFILMVLGARFILQRKQKRKRKQMGVLLEENEKLFLEFMILNYPKGYVSGHQIIAFFGKHKASPESQRQFRAKLIDGFTKGLGVIFPGIEVLDIRADQQDQRMLTYRLTETIYHELKKL